MSRQLQWHLQFWGSLLQDVHASPLERQELTQSIHSLHDGRHPCWFSEGFNYRLHSCKCSTQTNSWTLEHIEVVRDYLAQKCAECRVLGPFQLGSLLGVQECTFGIITKGKSGMWLAFPRRLPANSKHLVDCQEFMQKLLLSIAP